MKKVPPHSADAIDERLRGAGAEFRRLSTELLGSELEQKKEEAVRAAISAVKMPAEKDPRSTGAPAGRGAALNRWIESIGEMLSRWGRAGARARIAAAYACVTVLVLVGIQGRGRNGPELRAVDRGFVNENPAAESDGGELLISEEDLLEDYENGFVEEESAEYSAAAAELDGGEADDTLVRLAGQDLGLAETEEEEDEVESSALAFDSERLDGFDHQPFELEEEVLTETEDYDEEQYEQS